MTSFGFWLLVIVVWGYVAGSTLAAWRFARRPAMKAAKNPPVSVLKPLHGAEPGLYQNLRSFAEQDYPVYQLVLGVRDRMDAALPIARALIRDLPNRDIRLVVDPRVGGSNLKVANLENMLPVATHDVIVIADSDMRVAPDYLATVIAPLTDPATGIVTCPYKGVPTDGGLWSKLAALHINFGFLPGALAGDALDIGGGCFGATIALRREVLERIGGFARLRHELADDHRMGAAVRRLGLTAVLSRYIVENRVSEPSLASLWRHELRWARTSRAMAPVGVAGSIITHTAMLTALAAAVSGSAAAWLCAALALLLRWGSAVAVARWLGLPTAGMWLLPLRDALSFAVFLASFCGRNVSWRDQSFRVEPNGRMRIEGDKAA
jgi:ceramide glucosyltransferase